MRGLFAKVKRQTTQHNKMIPFPVTPIYRLSTGSVADVMGCSYRIGKLHACKRAWHGLFLV